MAWEKPRFPHSLTGFHPCGNAFRSVGGFGYDISPCAEFNYLMVDMAIYAAYSLGLSFSISTIIFWKKEQTIVATKNGFLYSRKINL
jgi:hypothetical protein